MSRAVHQLVPNLVLGDAISQQTLSLRALLRELGHRSEIFAHYVDARLSGEARPYAELADERNRDAAVLFHFSIASEVTNLFRQLPNRRAIVYHNVTPPRFFAGVNERVARDCERGRAELSTLRSSVALACADSSFNAAELAELGYPETAVLPIVVDPARYEAPPVPALEAKYRDGHLNLLHVGRLVPNKRLDDVLKIAHFVRRSVDPHARLFLVGIDVDTEIYAFGLRDLARELGLQGVSFAGAVSQAELAAYYRLADAYLCMSEHEGFCVPLVEAMLLGVPVIAYGATAVPETVGDGGIVLAEKRHAEIAEMIGVLRDDPALRARLVDAGRARARAFSPAAVRPVLESVVARLLA